MLPKVALLLACSACLAGFYFWWVPKGAATKTLTEKDPVASAAAGTAAQQTQKAAVPGESRQKAASKPESFGAAALPGRQAPASAAMALGVKEGPAALDLPDLPRAAAAPATIPATPLFPLAEGIVAGTSEERIRVKYGDPDVSTLTSSKGRIVTTYVYARDAGRSAVVILFEDGKVATAYKKTIAVPPPGFSAPRRWQQRNRNEVEARQASN